MYSLQTYKQIYVAILKAWRELPTKRKTNKQKNNFVTEIHQFPKELYPYLVAQLASTPGGGCYMGRVALDYIVLFCLFVSVFRSLNRMACIAQVRGHNVSFFLLSVRFQRQCRRTTGLEIKMYQEHLRNQKREDRESKIKSWVDVYYWPFAQPSQGAQCLRLVGMAKPSPRQTQKKGKVFLWSKYGCFEWLTFNLSQWMQKQSITAPSSSITAIWNYPPIENSYPE